VSAVIEAVMFNRNKTAELVVKPRVSPRVKILLAAAAGTLFVFISGWIYNYGLNMAGFARSLAVREQEQLQSELAKIKADNQDLREALVRAQRGLQMDQTAYQELDRSLKTSAQEIVKLREELNFYRNIISPPDKKSGLRIQSLSLELASQPNQYQYKLVLVQALKHDHSVYGTAWFEISGFQAGEDTVVRYPGPNDRKINVNFKYFQDIHGKLELPRNFEPRQVKVSVTAARGGLTVQETYAWPKV
jgi:hypothetical protein